MMLFEELTPDVRTLMLEEFRAEEAQIPYRPKVLTLLGERAFLGIVEEHLGNGNEISLAEALSPSSYWEERGVRQTKRGPVSYFLSAKDRARTFALTDFNTWYVRALCRKLISEGVEECEAYRAAYAYEPRGECRSLEGRALRVEDVLRGHRKKYHPEETKDPYALSIPFGPNCHHSIRRCG